MMSAGDLSKRSTPQRDYAGKFWGGTEWRIWVTDEAGATVCALKFSAE
jgi:hypothetical protein